MSGMPVHYRRVDDLGALVAGQRGEVREPLAAEAPVHVVVVGVDLAGLAHSDHRAVLRRGRTEGLHQHAAARDQEVVEHSLLPKRALDSIAGRSATSRLADVARPTALRAPEAHLPFMVSWA